MEARLIVWVRALRSPFDRIVSVMVIAVILALIGAVGFAAGRADARRVARERCAERLVVYAAGAPFLARGLAPGLDPCERLRLVRP